MKRFTVHRDDDRDDRDDIPTHKVNPTEDRRETHPERKYPGSVICHVGRSSYHLSMSVCTWYLTVALVRFCALGEVAEGVGSR